MRWRDTPCNVHFPTAATPCPRSWLDSQQPPPSCASFGTGVELDRLDGAKRALLGVERILKVLASGQLQDLAPGDASADELLHSHRERRAWRQQVLRGSAFTLCLAGIVFALAS